METFLLASPGPWPLSPPPHPPANLMQSACNYHAGSYPRGHEEIDVGAAGERLWINVRGGGADAGNGLASADGGFGASGGRSAGGGV